MRELNRIEMFENLQGVMTQFCEGCFLHKYLRGAEGKRSAHRFCITQCTVGEKLQEYGKKLSE